MGVTPLEPESSASASSATTAWEGECTANRHAVQPVESQRSRRQFLQKRRQSGRSLPPPCLRYANGPLDEALPETRCLLSDSVSCRGLDTRGPRARICLETTPACTTPDWRPGTASLTATLKPPARRPPGQLLVRPATDWRSVAGVRLCVGPHACPSPLRHGEDMLRPSRGGSTESSTALGRACEHNACA